MGDTKHPFCLQSCVKPLQYAIAVHEAGTENVHRYVGKEPSGLRFNMLSLDEEGVRGLFTLLKARCYLLFHHFLNVLLVNVSSQLPLMTSLMTLLFGEA